MINATIANIIFPNEAKLTSVKPIYKNPKNGSRLNISHYRPISVISVFSKVIEKHYESSMLDYVNSTLSKYLSGFRKGTAVNTFYLDLQKSGGNTLIKTKL